MRLGRGKGLDAETREAYQVRLWALVIGLIALVAYIVAFVAENNSRVTVHFVFFTTHTSVIWLILLGLVIGIVGGLLVSQLERRRRGRKQRG
jgi:uncharacterized integral membrane protein